MDLLHFELIWQSDLPWNQVFQIAAALVNAVFWGLKVRSEWTSGDPDTSVSSMRGAFYVVLGFGFVALALSPWALAALIVAVLALVSIPLFGMP